MPFRPEMFALMLPILALMIPIIAILTQHQRKMAELFHQNPQNQSNPEISALRLEVQELKQLIHQQAIAMDNLATMQARPTQPPTIQERIGTGAG